ncbi:MAG: histone deacetylase [Solirubrobacterales bacterium]|nr:histone deacetylase [Solirubrobacterales bacterium]
MALYVRHPSCFQHDTGGHPESARRLVAIEESLAERDWMGLEVVDAIAAEREQLLRVHEAALVDRIEDLSARGGGMIDLDTIASAGSWEAALHAAGAAAGAADRLLSAGDGGYAFCGTRPPGHHAERARAMGFCLFNNAAVAAAEARARHGTERVLILDWDVHHGNGTEEIFYGSSDVVYASIHQSPLYPGTGAATDLGTGEGEGFTVNLPVPPGSGPDEFLALVQGVIAPICREWKPGLMIVSAGYDAHRDDPLAECELDETAYADMTAAMRDLGSELGAPLLVLLEGGYSVTALARSVLATLDALAGDASPREAPGAFAAPFRERLVPFWPSLA